MGRKGHPLAARIKKIMQTDEDVGKIAQATPIMIGAIPALSCCSAAAFPASSVPHPTHMCLS